MRISSRGSPEAKTLAALNHPNITAIHGIVDLPADRLRQGYGESADASAKAEGGSPTGALVMELVEGEDGSAHIARGPMPLADALPIARQIAEALEAACRKRSAARSAPCGGQLERRLRGFSLVIPGRLDENCGPLVGMRRLF